MRDALSLRLEQISYFDHRALPGGRHAVIHAYRLIEIRGARYHVLSRLQDVGLDFTKRTNFIAHHLVFSPEEIPALPLPPDIFREWSGWAASWTQEPRLLTDEAWKSLKDVGSQSHTPAHTWERVTEDAANALGLLDCSAPIEADGIKEEDLLPLLSESLALLEVREPDSDYRTAAWRFTFTTALQDQDQVADFRWRFVHSGSPAYARLAASGRLPVPLAAVHPKSPTDKALKFAREGPQPLRIIREPEDRKIQEGQPLVLRVEIEGVPFPRRIQWFECASDGSMRQPIPNQNSVELPLEKLKQGVHRYRVQVANARGETTTSRVIKVEVNRTSRITGNPGSRPVSEPKDSAIDSALGAAADHARERHLREAKRRDEEAKRTSRNRTIKEICVVLLSLAILVFLALLGVRWRNSSNEFVRKLSEAQSARHVQEAKTIIAQMNTSIKLISLLPFQGRIISAVSNANAFITNEYRLLGDFTNALHELPEGPKREMTNSVELKKKGAAMESAYEKIAPEFKKEWKDKKDVRLNWISNFSESVAKETPPLKADRKTATEIEKHPSTAKPKEK